MTYDELITKIGALVEQSDEIVTRMAGVAEWPSEDKEKFDRLHTEIRKLGDTKKRIDLQNQVKSELSGSTRQTEPNELRGRGTPPPADQRSPDQMEEDADHVLRAWMLTQHGGDSSRHIKPEWRSAADRYGVNLHSSNFPYLKLTSVPPRSLRAEDMQQWETRTQREMRALTTTTTAGGYLISAEMNRALEEARLFYGGVMENATVIRTETGASLPFPTYNGTATKGRILGINTQATQTDPAIGQMLLAAFKYSSDMVLVPEELLQDSGVNMPAFLGRILGERIARILNEHFTTGTGTTQPWGVVVRAAAVNLGAGTAAGFGADAATTYRNVLKVVYGVDRAYRNNAKFMMNDAILANLAGITDTTGRPIWVTSMQAGEPDRLMGYPVVVNNDMTATFANNARTVLFGDFSNYYVREVRNVEIVSSRDRFIDFHQTAFLGFGRYDGDLLNAGTGPVKALVHQT